MQKDIKSNLVENFITYQESNLHIDSIAFELKNNKAAIIWTDTVPGIISLNKKLIYKIKGRPLEKKLIRFVSNLNQIENRNEKFNLLANEFWPGALTIVYKEESYRMPNSEFLLKLIDKTNVLYSSSANLSGLPPIKSKEEAFKYFGNHKNNIIFIDGNYSQQTEPSTVFDIDKNKILREGKIKNEQLEKYIKK